MPSHAPGMSRPTIDVPVPMDAFDRLIPAAVEFGIPVFELGRMAVENAARSYEEAGRARRPVAPVRAPAGAERPAAPASSRRASRVTSPPS